MHTHPASPHTNSYITLSNKDVTGFIGVSLLPHGATATALKSLRRKLGSVDQEESNEL